MNQPCISCLCWLWLAQRDVWHQPTATLRHASANQLETNSRNCSTAKLPKPRMTAGRLAGPPVDPPASCQPQCMPRAALCCCLLPLPYVFTSPPQCSLLILRRAHCHCNSQLKRKCKGVQIQTCRQGKGRNSGGSLTPAPPRRPPCRPLPVCRATPPALPWLEPRPQQ